MKLAWCAFERPYSHLILVLAKNWYDWIVVLHIETWILSACHEQILTWGLLLIVGIFFIWGHVEREIHISIMNTNKTCAIAILMVIHHIKPQRKIRWCIFVGADVLVYFHYLHHSFDLYASLPSTSCLLL